MGTLNGVGIVRVQESLFEIWEMEVSLHRQTGDFIKRVTDPLPPELFFQFLPQFLEKSGLPLIDPWDRV